MNGEKALVIHHAHVTRSKPPVNECVRRRIRPVPVLTHDVLTTNEHLAGLADWELITVTVSNLHFGEEERFSTGLGLSYSVYRVHEARGAAGFGEAVNLGDVDTHFLELLCQRDWYRSSTRHEPAHARPVVVLVIRHLNHEVQHRRHHEAACDFLALHAFPGGNWIKTAHHIGGCAVISVDGQWCERANVEHGKAGDITLIGLIVRCRVNREDTPHRCAVGMYHAFRQTGRARCVHDVQHVVVFSATDGLAV